MDIKLSFFGAARNVTGSNYLLEINGARLLVDCGFYQERDFRARNWEPFAYGASTIDAVLLTHAHLDHCGLLPKLVKDGFKGDIHCTPATAEIARIVMLDSARIQEEDVAYKRKRHKREGRESPHPYEPLYRVADAEAVLPLLKTTRYGKTVDLGGGVSCIFRDAGHILGAEMVVVHAEQNGEKRSMVFSGDIGRPNTPILRDPSPIDQVDYVVVESTYGNRTHKPNEEIPDILTEVINRTCKGGGNVVVPSFSVERAQELLYHLHELLRKGRIPSLTVYLDSPMAVRVTEVFRKHPELFDEETTEMLRRGEHPCDFPNLRMCRSVGESKAIKEAKEGAIIIAGSGMCTGGRIKHHIKANINRPESTILFVGYQAMGTLGRRLLEGAEKIRLHGEMYEVKARVEKVNGFSAHADRNELFEWLSGLKEAPRHVFVTHGEEDAAEAFSQLIESKTGWDVSVPSYGDEVVLE